MSLDAVRAKLAAFDGVLVWVNPIHEGRNRANLDTLLREVTARGVWVSAHPDVILKMGTKEVLHRTRTMNWGCDTALYRTAEAMRAELPVRLATGPRVIKRNRGNGGQGVWKVETLAGPRNRPMVRLVDATNDGSEDLAARDPRRPQAQANGRGGRVRVPLPGAARAPAGPARLSAHSCRRRVTRRPS
jgi:hypothetical protein